MPTVRLESFVPSTRLRTGSAQDRRVEACGELRVEPDTVDILKTGMSKADLRMVRQAHHERTEDSHALDYPCGPTGTKRRAMGPVRAELCIDSNDMRNLLDTEYPLRYKRRVIRST